VGGFQAVTADFTQVLVSALPWFLLIVVGLGFLALTVLFRSLLVPATGVLSSLLSLGAAMGITVAVFQWGWFAGPINLQSTGPIFPFLPVMVFAILFGLSCDYQVFLVSRMHEEWSYTGDNRKAVRRGLAGSGRVVAIAAAIMTSVFGAFVLGDDQTIKLFGVALSSAVLLDAFIVRLILIPSLMTIFGAANWWLPKWLDRVLPKISIESEDIAAGASEIEDVAPTPART
jgi:putative drug exporter of the RND superfamily